MAAAARGRYFMPLYPIVAVLIALLIECCSQVDATSIARRAWHRFLLLCSIAACSFGVLVAANSVLPDKSLIRLYQPASFALLYGACAMILAYAIWKAYSSASRHPSRPVIALTCLAGLSSAGLMVNVNAARWSDPTSAIAELKEQVPPGTRLASLAEIEHRFAYYYGEPIAQIPWPATAHDVPADLDYFVFMRHWDDTAERRVSGRGRSYYITSGTLPFEWEEIASFCSDRKTDTPTATSVVLGRVIRPLRAAVSDVSKPQRKIARLPTTVVK
jgi:hypothetical protein